MALLEQICEESMPNAGAARAARREHRTDLDCRRALARRTQMTDPVHSVAGHTTNKPRALEPRPGFLVLKGDAPLPVWVELFPGTDSRPIPGFAAEPGGGYFTDGIKWACGQQFSLFLTFKFPPKVAGVRCSLPYSASFGSPLMQQLVVPHVREEVQYSFIVVMQDGGFHDPKIVVTPINGEGNRAATKD
jgi:hypothetical protein